MPSLVLSPIQGRVSTRLAAAFQYVETISIALSFLAAVLIVREGWLFCDIAHLVSKFGSFNCNLLTSRRSLKVVSPITMKR